MYVAKTMKNWSCGKHRISLSQNYRRIHFNFVSYSQRPINRTDWPLDEIPNYLAADYQNLQKSCLKISQLLNTIFRRNIHHTRVFVIVFTMTPDYEHILSITNKFIRKNNSLSVFHWFLKFKAILRDMII